MAASMTFAEFPRAYSSDCAERKNDGSHRFANELSDAPIQSALFQKLLDLRLEFGLLGLTLVLVHDLSFAVDNKCGWNCLDSSE